MWKICRWFLDIAFPPVWVKPLIGTADDGFVSWKLSASGRILDTRHMSESKRFWQYGEMIGVKND
jgi:hypothetical protein